MQRGALYIVITVIVATCMSCASRYATIKDRFESTLYEQNLKKASRVLDNSKVYRKKRNAILYHMEKGKLLFLQGKHEESNRYFNKADWQVEDFKKTAGNQVLSYLVNDLMKDYRPRDFEVLGIYYYKALNYLALYDYENALVEARRMNLYLQQMSNRYKNEQKHYANDAFTHNLMGLIYEQSGDINNAFIAYRNAVDLYLEHQSLDEEYFNVSLPTQLKIDLLRMAKANRFMGEYQRYQELFQLPEDSLQNNDVLVFWENGLAPILSSETLSFGIQRSADNDENRIRFLNDQLDAQLLLSVTNHEFEQLAHLDMIRITIPSYYPRYQEYTQAMLQIGSEEKPLELAEDYFAIAKQVEKSQFKQELGKTLLRIALKEASKVSLMNAVDTDDEEQKEQEEEKQSKKEDEEERTMTNELPAFDEVRPNEKDNSIDFSLIAGIALGIYNYASEQADVRQWITLPSELYYTRISKEQLREAKGLRLSHRYHQQVKQIPLRQDEQNEKPYIYFSTY